jgi:hypothetical protein
MRENLRLRILIRDNYRCQSCGQKEKLHIHHILTGEDKRNIERAHNTVLDSEIYDHENNLITLCERCHSFTFTKPPQRLFLPEETRELKEIRLQRQELNHRYQILKRKYYLDWNNPAYQKEKWKIDEARAEFNKRENDIRKVAEWRMKIKRQDILQLCDDHLTDADNNLN